MREPADLPIKPGSEQWFKRVIKAYGIKAANYKLPVEDDPYSFTTAPEWHTIANMMHIMAALLFRQQTTSAFVYLRRYGDDEEDEELPSEIASPLLEATPYERLIEIQADDER